MRFAVFAALVLLTGSPAFAQEYGAHAAVRTDRRGEEVAAGDVRIEVGELARVPRPNAQNLLTLAPGVLLTNHGGEGHTAGMFLRGFDAGEGEDVEFLVEGVPLNELSNHHGHGYADTAFLLPEVVSDLRVVEGPFDPAQGDFAVAGSAEYTLGLSRPGVLSSFGIGQYRRRRLVLAWRPSTERARTFGAVGFARGDGFATSRAFSQASALGQYEAKVGPGTLLRTLLFAGAQRWDSAGVIREDDFGARGLPCARSLDPQFFCTYDPNQGGSGQRVGLATTLERTRASSWLRAQAFATVRGLRTKENFTGFNEDPAASFGELQRGDLRDGRTDAVTLGARALTRRHYRWRGHQQTGEIGLYLRHDQISSVMDRVRRDLDVPYMTDFERKIRQTHVAMHGQLDVRPWRVLRVSLGARGDAFAFHAVDLNQPAQDRIGPRLTREATDAYGFAASPRGTIDLQLLEGLHWLTSAGLGARSSDATALSESESAPFARVTSAETGLALHRDVGELVLESRASAFFTRVSRDLVFDPVAGRNQPTGPSHRLGGMAMLRARLPGWADALASVAYTEAHLPPRSASVYAALAGPRVPFVPTWLVRGDAVLNRSLRRFPEVSGFAALGATVVGKRPLPYGEWARRYAIVDASAGARYQFVELAASMTNVFDARYREAEFSYASNFDGPDAPRSQVPARHFSAGAPRQWLLTLTVHLDSLTLESAP